MVFWNMLILFDIAHVNSNSACIRNYKYIQERASPIIILLIIEHPSFLFSEIVCMSKPVEFSRLCCAFIDHYRIPVLSNNHGYIQIIVPVTPPYFLGWHFRDRLIWNYYWTVTCHEQYYRWYTINDYITFQLYIFFVHEINAPHLPPYFCHLSYFQFFIGLMLKGHYLSNSCSPIWRKLWYFI